ncbi:MAG: M28 family peptidase, partial [Hymenobacter sp.]
AMHAGRHAEWSDLLADSLGTVLALLFLNLGQSGYRRLTAATAALLLAGPTAHAQPTADAPDLIRARHTIEALAAPAMHGRGYVQQGEHVAAAYLRGRLQALSLKPLAPDYTQSFTLDVNTFPGEASLQLSRSRWPQFGKQYTLQVGRDFIAAPNSAGSSEGIYQPVCYLDSATLTTPARLAYFLQFTHHPCIVIVADHYAQQPTHQPAIVSARLDSAAAVISVVPKLTASLAPQQSPTVQLQVLPNSLFNFTPNSLASTAAIAGRVRLDAQLIHDYQTQNLAAVARGRTQPDSFVVVTAHYDHLGMMGKNTYFPGANDNASGVALLLELAAHYARPENQPACSVAFLLFGAEEAGLLGSSYFVQH